MKSRRIYLAYGSNMNIQQMARRCPEAKLLGTSCIEGYSLEFHGRKGGAVATIIPQKDSRVPVAVWELSESDELSLDMYEGFPRLYYKKDLSVFLGKRKVQAFAYIMAAGYPVEMPSEYYFNVILAGYTDNDVDTQTLFNALYETRKQSLA